MKTLLKKAPACLLAVALMALGTTRTPLAAAPALQGQVTLRPLTPQEIKNYGLTGVQGASGLSAVGVGQPVYLEALVNFAVTNADITNVTWILTAKPVGSQAALAPSPLGTNVPTFKIADRINQAGAPTFKVVGRTMLRPDVTGSYTVNLAIETSSSGSTNLTQKLTAATYLGVATCALCHSGGILAPDKYPSLVEYSSCLVLHEGH